MVVIIVFASTGLGFYQEYRAGNALAELRRRVAVISVVRRDGRSVELPSAELVPGDVVLLAPAVIVHALGAAHAAEVEAQHGRAVGLEGLGGAEHHLEVHHPAVQRVGVAHDRGRDRLALGVHEHRLQAAGRAGQIERLVASHRASSLARRAWRGLR